MLALPLGLSVAGIETIVQPAGLPTFPVIADQLIVPNAVVGPG